MINRIFMKPIAAAKTIIEVNMIKLVPVLNVVLRLNKNNKNLE